MPDSKKHILIPGLAAVWCVILILPSLLNVWFGEANIISAFIYRFFSPICHQFDSHSFHLFGYKFAVCARCSSIYFGFFLGAIIYPFLKNSYIKSNIKLWLIAAFPMVLDVFLDFFRFHSASLISRSITGTIFGCAAAMILVPILKEAINSFSFRFHSYRRSST